MPIDNGYLTALLFLGIGMYAKKVLSKCFDQDFILILWKNLDKKKIFDMFGSQYSRFIAKSQMSLTLRTCYSYLALETIFDENTNDTNIENDNAVTVVGDGTDIIVEDTIEDKGSSGLQQKNAPVALAEVDLQKNKYCT